MKIQDTSGIKRIGLVVSVVEDRVNVLDHTGVWRYEPMMPQYGVPGYLGQMLGLKLVEKAKAHGSMGGSIDDLTEVLPVYSAGSLLTQKLSDRLTGKYEVVGLEPSGKDFRIENYLATTRQKGIDTLLKVDLVYGLAVYDGAQSSADIDAAVSVYDGRSGILLFEKAMRSDEQFRSGNTVSKFKADGAALFKKDIAEAADGLAMLVASELGMQKEPSGKGLYRNLNARFTCSEPFALAQDCSNRIGPIRKVELKGYRMKVAGSKDGKVLFVAFCSCLEKATDREGVTSIVDQGVDIGKCASAVLEEFGKNGINIIRTNKARLAFGAEPAFIYELDQDGYSLLKRYTVEAD